MSHWDYRIARTADGSEFKIIEVYYDDEGRKGWADNHDSRLTWPDEDDLRGTIPLLANALERPVMQINDDDSLTEITPGKKE